MSIEPTDWPDLGVPAPRQQARPCNVIAWPERGRFDLSSEAGPCEPEVERLLRSRRTDRTIGSLSVDQLGPWFELSCRAQEVHSSNYGFDLSLRPSPSAGAIHPIHLILALPGVAPFMRYDAIDHVLVETPTQLVASEVHRAMQGVLPAPDATLVLLAAEVGKTAAKYEHPASLVWRDAGALLAVLGLSAHALGLGFCPLGVTGEPWVSGLLEQQGLFGVGAAFVGRRSPLG
jgi:hypothetical protein